MESSLSSLTFKGSIPEAIAEAKNQRKPFVVYISGGNAESNQLEQSTWTNINVAESVKKHCIFLHLSEGSIDAAHFCAIYPQNHIPCITAIGCNGVLLWKLEGCIDADVLVSNLEKAWFDIHIQQTTATVISAALASRKSVPSAPGTSNATSSSQEKSSVGSVHQHLKSKNDIEAENNENNNSGRTTEGKTYMDSDSKKSSLLGIKNSKSIGNENSTAASKAAKELLSPTPLVLENATGANTSTAEGSPMEEINNSNLVSPIEGQRHTEENGSLQTELGQPKDDSNANEINNHARVPKSTDVHLNIRLPNATNLQEKFASTSTLRTVKEFVDEKLTSVISHYDLAIPYPRKTFSNEDLNKSLLELGLSDRQALIVVPHRNADQNSGLFSYQKVDSSSVEDDSVGGNGGYFAYLKRILAYVNPLSYLGGANASTSGQEPQNGIWEYGSNPALRNNLVGAERPYSPYQPNRNGSPMNRNDDRSRQQLSRFGSNIHTLRHDEDDKPIGDRNDFWNGNSTQFSGNSDGN